jgi:hypothetical protein
MKKILIVVALFGFGMMVGCGDDSTTKKTSGTGVSKTTTETTKTTTEKPKST